MRVNLFLWLFVLPNLNVLWLFVTPVRATIGGITCDRSPFNVRSESGIAKVEFGDFIEFNVEDCLPEVTSGISDGSL